MSDALSTATLAQCEAVIERGLSTWIDVGEALSTIRTERLYRETHGTFEDYCRDRWGFSRIQAHRLEEAAEVAQVLPIGNRPQTESQARELVPVLRKQGPDAAAAVMAAVVAATKGHPTAAAIRELVQEHEAAHAQRTEDRAALTKLAGNFQAAGLDPETLRRGGEFTRLCRDLAALLDPTEFVSRQGRLISDKDVALAHAARDWLDRFLTAWSDHT